MRHQSGPWSLSTDLVSFRMWSTAGLPWCSAQTSSAKGCPLRDIEVRRLLSSFQSSLEEITIIARPTDDHGLDAMTKALQLQSYNDPSRCEHSWHFHALQAAAEAT